MESVEGPELRIENCSFNDIVVQLQSHLGVSESDIKGLFSNNPQFSNNSKIFNAPNAIWTIQLSLDQTATISRDGANNTDLIYRIGIQSVKKYDAVSKEMRPTTTAILLERLHLSKPNIGLKAGKNATGHYLPPS